MSKPREEAFKRFRRSAEFQFGFVIFSGREMNEAIDRLCASAEALHLTLAEIDAGTFKHTCDNCSAPYGCVNLSECDCNDYCPSCKSAALDVPV
jgi:hypothetical protein